jgi:hypothetical protein
MGISPVIGRRIDKARRPKRPPGKATLLYCREGKLAEVKLISEE